MYNVHVTLARYMETKRWKVGGRKLKKLAKKQKNIVNNE